MIEYCQYLYFCYSRLKTTNSGIHCFTTWYKVPGDRVINILMILASLIKFSKAEA